MLQCGLSYSLIVTNLNVTYVKTDNLCVINLNIKFVKTELCLTNLSDKLHINKINK